MIRTLIVTSFAALLALAGPLSAAEDEGDSGAELLSRMDSVAGRTPTSPNDETVARVVGRSLSYGMSTKLQGVFVSSESGVVTLRGTVTDAEARDEAVWRASRVDGVYRIINRLATPDSPAPDSEHEVRDATLRASTGVFEATPVSFLLSDNRAGRDILVDVGEGAATLSGEVNNKNAHRAAVAAAWRIPGVRAVFDHLEVREGSTVDDGNLSGIVRHRIAEVRELQPYVSEAIRPTIARNRADYVEITVDEGVARLDGKVQTDGERALIEEIAAGVTGVFAVDSRLQVDGDLRVTNTRPPLSGPIVTELWNYGSTPILRRER